MDTTAGPAAQKINLRRPEIMKAVQAEVISHYRSELVERIRAGGGVLTTADGRLTVKLAKEFGFCYGVERAIDLAYAARRSFPPETRICLLGEIIHNPEVNDQIRKLGIISLSSRPTPAEMESINAGDVIIIPAFGTQVDMRRQLEQKGCVFVDTTCGDVMSVWKRVRQYTKENITSIIHGKAKHEETMATTSQVKADGDGHYLVVYNLAETDYVCNYIRHGGSKTEFLERFKRAHSPGFDPDLHLHAVGVANQTTMLRGETEEVQRRFKAAMEDRFGLADLNAHFRYFDTICGATQERQDALLRLLEDPLDLLLVIGGYNSSNTSHLAEMGEARLRTYFIKNAAKMASDQLIVHYDLHKHQEVETLGWLPAGSVTVGITAGASCPNNLIEDAVRRLFELRGYSVHELLAR